MELPKDYEETVGITGDYETLEAGGYICKIINAKEEISKNGRQMLVIAFDIAEGEHKDIYKRRYDELVQSNKDPNKQIKWPNNGIHRIMVKNKDEGTNRFFKGFMSCIESSNTNYKFTGDEKTLKDKLFGGIFREEEYEKMDGSIGISCKIDGIRSVNTIRDGKFKTPEIKRLPAKGEAFEGFMSGIEDNDDLPF